MSFQHEGIMSTSYPTTPRNVSRVPKAMESAWHAAKMEWQYKQWPACCAAVTYPSHIEGSENLGSTIGLGHPTSTSPRPSNVSCLTTFSKSRKPGGSLVPRQRWLIQDHDPASPRFGTESVQMVYVRTTQKKESP